MERNFILLLLFIEHSNLIKLEKAKQIISFHHILYYIIIRVVRLYHVISSSIILSSEQRSCLILSHHILYYYQKIQAVSFQLQLFFNLSSISCIVLLVYWGLSNFLVDWAVMMCSNMMVQTHVESLPMGPMFVLRFIFSKNFKLLLAFTL